MRIYERPDSPCWYAEFTTSDGATHRKSTGVTRGPRTRKSALAEGEALRTRVEANQRKVKSMSLKAAAESYLGNKDVKATLAPRTHKLYSEKLSDVVVAFPTTTLSELSPSWVRDFVQDRRAAEITDIQIRKEIIALSSMMNHTLGRLKTKERIDLGVPEVNPFKLVSKKELALGDYDKKERALRIEQIEALWTSCGQEQSEFWLAWFEVIVEGGFRLEEVLGLPWGDVDWKDMLIRLGLTTKGKASRNVPITPIMESALKRMDALPIKDGVHVFVNQETGQRYQQLWKQWDVIRKRAGVPDARIHDLRASFSAITDEAGISDSERMSIQGHNTESMQRKYRGSRATSTLHRVIKGKSPLEILRKKKDK